MLLIVSPPTGTTLKEVGELFPPAVYLVHSFYQAVAIKLYLVLESPQPTQHVVVTIVLFWEFRRASPIYWACYYKILLKVKVFVINDALLTFCEIGYCTRISLLP